MKGILLFSITLLCSMLWAQESYHVVPEGSEWKLETTNITVRYLSIITVAGDEEIGGEMCQKFQVQGYTRYTQGMNMTWGPLIVGSPNFLYLRRNGINIEIYRNGEWNLLFKTQTYIGEVWYQGLAEGENPVYVRVVDIPEGSGRIKVQPCTESGELIENGSPQAQNTYSPFWDTYHVGYISEWMPMINEFYKMNNIYCPFQNYSCFDNYPISGLTCESNMLTLSVEAEMQNVLQIFPNPSVHGFFVSGITEPSNILVCDLSGALVAQFQNHADPSALLDMSHLRLGAYSILIQSASQTTQLLWVKLD